MKIQFANLILILAAAQGFFLSVLILHKYGNLKANRFLGALMLVYSILLTHLFLGEEGVLYPEFLLRLVIGTSFLIGPLHFLYARSLINPTLNRRHWLHALPFLAYILLCVWAYIFDPLNTTLFVQEMFVKYTWFHWIILSHVISYMTLTVVLVQRYTKAIKDVFSDIHRVRLNWLRNLTLLAFMIMFVYFAENFFLLYHIELSHQFDLSSLIIAIYVYIIGYLGVFKSEVFAEPAIAESIKHLELSPKKYEKSGLTSDKAHEFEHRLLEHMQGNKPWLESELTLGQLAAQLAIPPHYLSEVINSRFDLNFFNFINQYRLEQVKQDLVDPTKGHLKILAIAFDAGFNSKSTFNNLFREQEGMTPSEYRKHVMGKR